MTKILTSNTDLYDYLLSLADLLEGRGSLKLAASLRLAARQTTSLSTEFLGESRIALKAVIDSDNGLLRFAERDELLGILSQVEIALRR